MGSQLKAAYRKQYLASFDDEAEAKVVLAEIVAGLKLGSLFIEI